MSQRRHRTSVVKSHCTPISSFLTISHLPVYETGPVHKSLRARYSNSRCPISHPFQIRKIIHVDLHIHETKTGPKIMTIAVTYFHPQLEAANYPLSILANHGDPKARHHDIYCDAPLRNSNNGVRTYIKGDGYECAVCHDTTPTSVPAVKLAHLNLPSHRVQDPSHPPLAAQLFGHHHIMYSRP